MGAFILLLLGGIVPLAFAIATRRRWLRITLALAAGAWFAMWLPMAFFVSDGARAHGLGLAGLQLILGLVLGIGVLAALVLLFVPTRDVGGSGEDYVSNKQLASGSDDLTPKS